MSPDLKGGLCWFGAFICFFFPSAAGLLETSEQGAFGVMIVALLGTMAATWGMLDSAEFIVRIYRRDKNAKEEQRNKTS